MDDTREPDPQLTQDIHPDDRLVVVKEGPFNAETGHPALAACSRSGTAVTAHVRSSCAGFSAATARGATS